MNTKLQWIFDEPELVKIEKYKLEMCNSLDVQLDLLNQQELIKNHLQKFIQFMRSRKKQLQYPLKFQKIICYSVALFKRFYLINPLIDQPTQNLICAVYTSLKLNQYDEGFIAKMALKWLEKDVFCPTKRFPHYGQLGYTQAQMKFLSGIKFQTSLSKLIQPLESIYQQINEIYHINSKKQEPQDKKQDYYELIKEILYQLDKIYLHPNIIFLYEGSKLALAIIVSILRKKGLQLNIMGKHLQYMVEANLQEIDRIIDYIDMDPDIFYMNHNIIKKKKIHKFKKPDPKKVTLSPKFLPKPQTFPNLQ